MTLQYPTKCVGTAQADCVCSFCIVKRYTDNGWVDRTSVEKLLGPTESQRRKETPVFTGMLRYFPRACRAVARLSFKGDRKHNPDKAPGEPPTWTRNKSADHGDCIVRHQITFDEIDPENGEYHAVAVAWRALAQLEILLEERGVE